MKRPKSTTLIKSGVDRQALKMTLTKAQLAEQLSQEIGFTQKEAKSVVDQFFKQIALALVQGDPVSISRLGQFSLRDKSARMGRNPKTNVPYPIVTRRVVTFRPSKILIKRINKNQGCHKSL